MLHSHIYNILQTNGRLITQLCQARGDGGNRVQIWSSSVPFFATQERHFSQSGGTPSALAQVRVPSLLLEHVARERGHASKRISSSRAAAQVFYHCQ